MAGNKVSGSVVSFSASTPTGITSASTNAEKVTAYEAVAGYTTSTNCIITELPSFAKGWEMNKDPDTVCSSPNELTKSYKTNRTVSDTTIAMLYEKADPMIAVLDALEEDPLGVGTNQIVGSNGTDKVWAQVQISNRDEMRSDIKGKEMISYGITFEEVPVAN